MLAALHSERFVDQSPAAVYARLLDEGTYFCSQRTVYRLLEGAGEGAPASGATSCATPCTPNLSCLASRPNEVWSWDITKLLGPAKWTYF